MHPIVFSSRVDKPGGLWTPKIGGIILEGDPNKTSFVIEGRVEIKEFSDHLRLFFQDVEIVQRKIIIREDEKNKIIERYHATKKKYLYSDDQVEESVALERKKKEESDIHDLISEVENRKIPLPKLHVFMSKKKPKERMIDIHKSGSRIHLQGDVNGYFGTMRTTGNFETSLKDIPDALAYLGLVIVKLPGDEPRTEEPVVYAYAKLNSARQVKAKTSSQLHFDEISETLGRLLDDDGGSKMKKVNDAIKSLKLYSVKTGKAWASFSKTPDEEIDFATFLEMATFCDIFLTNAQAKRIFDAVDVKRSETLGMSEFENFLMAYDVLQQASSDLIVLDLYDSLMMRPQTEAFGEFGNHEGMDYSGFCEAIEMLKVKGKTKDEIVEAFCAGADAKITAVANTYLTLPQFKKAWLRLADLELELTQRKLKFDSGPMGASRNRDRVNRLVSDQEVAYLDNVAKVNGLIENVKKDRREKKDAKKRDQAAYRDQLQHAAALFIAARGQEKRLQVKQEQEERAKKRLEEKVLRNKLLQRQEEAKLARRAEIAEKNKQAEKLRSEEIRALGYDRIDFSVQQLREIPLKVYGDEEASNRLSYAETVDFSKNILESLPPKKFFFWMTETRKLKLSQNRLTYLPDEMASMINLQILELDTNRLERLPANIDTLTALQRLDVSNNRLETIPPGIGNSIMLRFLYAHSNRISMMPTAMGNLIKLEFVDLSRNLLRELPEDLEHCINLTHLDLSSNRMGHLPSNLGNCKKLVFLDVSANHLAYLPDSFSNLHKLELCNLDNNELLIGPARFGGMSSLNRLTMKHNVTRQLFPGSRRPEHIIAYAVTYSPLVT